MHPTGMHSCLVKKFILSKVRLNFLSNNSVQTRMHSSRIRTVHCSGHLGGCLPRGGVCPGWEVCLGGCLPQGVCLWGVCLPRRWGVLSESVCSGGVHPLVDRMTDACENITFPQLLLRTVITISNPVVKSI